MFVTIKGFKINFDNINGHYLQNNGDLVIITTDLFGRMELVTNNQLEISEFFAVKKEFDIIKDSTVDKLNKKFNALYLEFRDQDNIIRLINLLDYEFIPDIEHSLLCIIPRQINKGNIYVDDINAIKYAKIKRMIQQCSYFETL